MRGIGFGLPSAAKTILGHEGAFAVILTGDKLDEICRAAWGAFWKTVLAPRWGTTRQRLHRLSQRQTGHGKEIKRQLLVSLEDHIALLCRYAQELRDDLM